MISEGGSEEATLSMSECASLTRFRLFHHIVYIDYFISLYRHIQVYPFSLNLSLSHVNVWVVYIIVPPGPMEETPPVKIEPHSTLNVGQCPQSPMSQHPLELEPKTIVRNKLNFKSKVQSTNASICWVDSIILVSRCQSWKFRCFCIEEEKLHVGLAIIIILFALDNLTTTYNEQSEETLTLQLSPWDTHPSTYPYWHCRSCVLDWNLAGLSAK